MWLAACTRALVENLDVGMPSPIGPVPYGALLGYEPNLPASGSHNVVGLG